MDTISATAARKSLYSLVDQAAHEPVLIIGKRHNAVLVSQADWKAIEETLYLLSIPGMRESIKKGLQTPVEKCETELRW